MRMRFQSSEAERESSRCSNSTPNPGSSRVRTCVLRRSCFLMSWTLVIVSPVGRVDESVQLIEGSILASASGKPSAGSSFRTISLDNGDFCWDGQSDLALEA